MQQNNARVAQAWNDTISELGIEPVFPPEEDVYVGDIYAVITRADKAFIGRSIKLSHLDLSDELKNTYKSLPVFPETAKRPDHDGDPWIQNTADANLFGGSERKVLPLTAFPGFSVRHSRYGEAGLSSGRGLLGWASGLFSTSRDNEETEEIQIPAAESYGIGALKAIGWLSFFCNDPKTSPACTERGARRMLSMVVGEEIWRPELDKKTKKETGRYAMGVELLLVNRVYLTRSMVHIHSVDSKAGAMGRLAGETKDSDEQGQGTATAPSGNGRDSSAPSGAGARGSIPSDKAVQEAIPDTQRERLQRVIGDVPVSVPGGTVTISAVEGSRIALNQTFIRPVAIGFRAVRLFPVRDGSDEKPSR